MSLGEFFWHGILSLLKSDQEDKLLQMKCIDILWSTDASQIGERFIFFKFCYVLVDLLLHFVLRNVLLMYLWMLGFLFSLYYTPLHYTPAAFIGFFQLKSKSHEKNDIG